MRTSSFKMRVKLDDYCNYCCESCHWKVDCLVLQAKNKGGRFHVKTVAAASFAGRSSVPFSLCEPDVLEAYVPFIRDGFLSLVGNDVKVPIKILRDTGAYDSYIMASVLPLSTVTDTGDCILSRGMGFFRGMAILPVPLHKVMSCELVQGEVAVGVWPALPVEGVHFILGNGLAGSHVWADSPSSVVSLCCPAPSLVVAC